jgi:MgsA AAA+ ATPase C terminal
VIASEDIGPVAPGIAAEIRALNKNWTEGRNKGGEEVFVAHAVVLLATAPKSRVTDWAVLHHLSDSVERREIPNEAVDQHTRRGRQMGRGRQHFMEVGSALRPWTGSLDALEAGYREKVRQLIDNDPDRPSNPWGADAVSKKLHTDEEPRSESQPGQLELGGES